MAGIFGSMQSGMNPQLMQLLQQMQGGAPQGFMQPANGAPAMPQAGQRGAFSGGGQLPSAFGANGQMNGQNGQQGGMFSSLAQNPQMMQMLAAKMQGNPSSGQMQGPPMAAMSGGATGGQMQGPMPDEMNQGSQASMGGMQPGMLQQLLARLQGM